MDPDSIMLGKYSLPFILSVILGLIYKRIKISDDLKPYIAMVVGTMVGIAALFYNVSYADITFVAVSDYALAGGMAGSAAVGIYEMNKSGPTGKSYIAIDQNNKRIQGARVAKINKIKIMK